MIKNIYMFFFVFACSIGLWACTSKEEGFKNLNSSQFEMLIQDKEVQLLDVRTPAEYSEGHIPSSLNLNAMDEDFASHVDEQLSKEHPVAVYCRSGKRSRKAADILVKKGFEVYNLDKGITNWKEEGRDIEL